MNNEILHKKIDGIIAELESLKEPFLDLPFADSLNLLGAIDYIKRFKERSFFDISKKERAYLLNIERICYEFDDDHNLYIVRRAILEQARKKKRKKDREKVWHDHRIHLTAYNYENAMNDVENSQPDEVIVQYILDNEDFYQQLLKDERDFILNSSLYVSDNA